MKSIIYDAGALIAAERNDRRLWADHRVRLELGVVPCVPAPVLAQVSRSARQVQLRRLLRGCEVDSFDEADAHAAGRILAQSKTSDIADASVVATAVARGADIKTSDREDIEHLMGSIRARISIVDI
jgi:predicted nucleic acid-binding protein